MLHHLLLASSFAGPLDNASFSAGLTGWTVEEGARASEAGELRSTVAVRRRALHLSGNRDVRRWDAVTQRIDVRAGQRLILTGRVRARDVRKEPGQLANCHVHVLFLDALGDRVDVAGTGCPSESGWQPFTVEALVPRGTAMAKVGMFLSMSGDVWFDDLDLVISGAPGPVSDHAAWRRLPFRHAEVRFAPETPDLTRVVRWAAAMDEAVAAMLTRTELVPDLRPTVYVYGTPEEAALLNRPLSFALPAQAVVHQDLAGSPGHEMAHVVTHRGWGVPSSEFLSEGAAVWLNGGPPPHAQVATERTAGTLPALRDLIDRFRDYEGQLHTYAVAGSFVAWLVDTYSIAALRDVWLAEDVPAALETATAMRFEALEAAWLARL